MKEKHSVLRSSETLNSFNYRIQRCTVSAVTHNHLSHPSCMRTQTHTLSLSAENASWQLVKYKCDAILSTFGLIYQKNHLLWEGSLITVVLICCARSVLQNSHTFNLIWFFLCEELQCIRSVVPKLFNFFPNLLSA